ncbi:MAG: hypothetical protein DRP87_08455 [Spirochaetes bacterium]|nr:MAG: hypothetical protein DRP87_08455 [Spirochaetota bacterium]
MIRYEYSKALKRKIRRDDPEDLSISTWDLVRSEIKEGHIEKALDYLFYGEFEAKQMHDILAAFPDVALTWLAKLNGEETIMKIFRERYFPRAQDFIEKIKTPEEAMYRLVEQQRAHFSSFSVTEEEERYVVVADPCGSGGRIRREKEVGVTREPHIWSWGLMGIPYYCCHCCAYFEIFPIELRGYPIRVHEISADHYAPCVHYYYKDPKKIPERFYTRIGLRKET